MESDKVTGGGQGGVGAPRTRGRARPRAGVVDFFCVVPPPPLFAPGGVWMVRARVRRVRLRAGAWSGAVNRGRRGHVTDGPSPMARAGEVRGEGLLGPPALTHFFHDSQRGKADVEGRFEEDNVVAPSNSNVHVASARSVLSNNCQPTYYYAYDWQTLCRNV